MERYITYFLLLFCCFACTEQPSSTSMKQEIAPAYLTFDEKKADYLYHFAFDCIDQEYPNKLGQVYEMGKTLPNPAMTQLAKQHFDFSYEKMDSGEYAGSHWLASFAAYALLKGVRSQESGDR